MLGGGGKGFFGGLIGLALFALIPLIYAWLTGAASIPHNDDWAFTRILFHLVETGEVKLVGWNEMVLLGHLFWAYPLVKVFGEHIGLLDTAGTLFSAAGIVGAALLAKRFVAAPYALATGALLAVFPGYVQTSVSYMTDPISFLAQLVCFYVGLKGIERDDKGGQRLIAVSMLIGLFAFSIREFAVITPLAVAVGALTAQLRNKRIRIATVASVALFLLAAGMLYSIRQSIPDGNSHAFGSPGLMQLVVLTSQSLFTLGLAASPVILFLVRRKPEILLGCLNAGAVLGLGLAVVALQNSADITTCCLGGRPSVFVGNALIEHGMLGNQVLLGQRPVLFPYPLWIALSALGVAGGVVGSGWMWSAGRTWLAGGTDMEPPVAALATWGVVTGAAIVTRAALGGPLFDRYLTIPLLVALILAFRAVPKPESVRPPRSALALLAVLALVSLSLVTSGLSFDLARWRAGESAVRDGLPASAVDAGFEWVGFHYAGVAHEDLPPVTTRMGPGYLDAFPAAGNCILVSASEQDHPDLLFVRTIPYRVWFGLGEQRLWVYRNPPACEDLGLT